MAEPILLRRFAWAPEEPSLALVVLVICGRTHYLVSTRSYSALAGALPDLPRTA